MNISAYLALLRPAQWIKNLMLLFPPFLGGTLLHAGTAATAACSLPLFCLASSATYVFNDIRDRESDALHPRKKNRPIGSGKVSTRNAAILAVVLFSASVAGAAFVSSRFLALLVLYAVVSLSYSLKLKQIALLDIFCISAGFLIRLEAGGEAFGIAISDWLFLSVFLLSVFLSTGKRVYEKNLLGGGAGDHRRALSAYPPGFLEGAMFLTGAAVLVTYTMYVIARHSLVYTVPLCCFGLLRFIMRVQAGEGGDPTESLLHDRQLLIVGLLWALAVALVIYG